MEKIVIRKATIDDLEAIQTLNQMLFVKEQREYDPILNCEYPFEKEGQEYFKKQIIGRRKITYAAVNQEKVIGYITGSYKNESTAKNHCKIAYLENFLILEGYRGQGVGTELSKKLIDWARKNKAIRIVVTAYCANKKGIDFYKKQGFETFITKLKIDF